MEIKHSQTLGKNNDTDHGAEQADAEDVNSVSAFSDLRCNGVPVCVKSIHPYVHQGYEAKFYKYKIVYTVWGIYARG